MSDAIKEYIIGLKESHRQGEKEYEDLKMRFNEEKRKTKQLREEVKKLKKKLSKLEDRNSVLNRYSRFDVMEIEDEG